MLILLRCAKNDSTTTGRGSGASVNVHYVRFVGEDNFPEHRILNKVDVSHTILL